MCVVSQGLGMLLKAVVRKKNLEEINYHGGSVPDLSRFSSEARE